jgi:N-acetylneuraminic acid mutarotase
VQEYDWGANAYNPATNTWTSRGPSTPASWFTNGIGNIGNKLYISGGRDGSYQMLSSFSVYDPSTNRSTSKANMPRPTALGVTGSINDKLYVLAGYCLANNGLEVNCRSLYRYDRGTNSWASLARSPHPHASGVGGVIGGKFYVAGGCCSLSRAYVTYLDVYDPLTNSWKALAPMPESRSGATGAVLGGKLYVVGGGGRSGERAVFAYDPVTNTWKTRASMIVGGPGLAAARVTLSNGQPRLFVAGYGKTEMYTP